MNEKELNRFLEDLTYNSTFRILDSGKDKEEIAKIAKKVGIKLPAHDLAIFSCIYAYTDRFNKNGCLLPKEEVEKALDTLPFKAVDFDHLRKRIVGTWVYAKLEKDEIIAYGVFYKGNFPDEYKDVKELMNKKNLAVSFESWGNREYVNGSKYKLVDIEFAGGALLLKTKPAFDGAEVLEMSKERVLEFAKVMTPPDSFIHTGDKLEIAYTCECIKCGKKITTTEHCANLKCSGCGGQMRRAERPGPGRGTEDLPELARFYVYDTEQIVRLVREVDCLTCKEKGMYEILAIDFEKNNSRFKCVNCQAVMNADLTPSARLVKKGRKVKAISLDETTKASLEKRISSVLEKLEKSVDLSEIEEFSALPKQVTTCVTAKVKDGIKSSEAVKQCWASFKKGNDESIEEFIKENKKIEDSKKQKISKEDEKSKMKQLLERYKKATVEEVFQEIAKTTINRELTKEELEKAFSVIDVPKSNVKVDKTGTNSLQDLKDKTATGNPTSLINAEITEDMIKNAITKATEVKKEVKKEEVKKDVDTIAKDKEIADLKTKLTDSEVKVKKFEDEKAAEVKKKTDALIKSRRDELAEFAKDVKDEDLLDPVKYENLKLRKALDTVNKGGKVDVVELIKGSVKKEEEDSVKKSRKNVKELAYGKQDEEKK